MRSASTHDSLLDTGSPLSIHVTIRAETHPSIDSENPTIDSFPCSACLVPFPAPPLHRSQAYIPIRVAASLTTPSLSAMENRRTPDQDIALSSNLNTTGGKFSVCSYLDRPSPVLCRISCQVLTDLARSQFPSPLLTPPLAAPGTTLHERTTAFPSTLHSSTTSVPRLPSYSTLAHSQFSQHLPHPSGDHSHQPLAPSSYPPPSTSAPTNAHRPLSGPSTSNSSMIVSGLSFYDPAHATAVPDYHELSRWDAPFDPSFPDVAADSLAPRDPAFLSGSTSVDDFQFIHAATDFGLHRTNTPSGVSQLHPQRSSQLQQQRRQIVPIPRRQVAPRHRDPTETRGEVQTHPLAIGQVQAEQREQSKAENQVGHLTYLFIPILTRIYSDSRRLSSPPRAYQPTAARAIVVKPILRICPTTTVSISSHAESVARRRDRVAYITRSTRHLRRTQHPYRIPYSGRLVFVRIGLCHFSKCTLPSSPYRTVLPYFRRLRGGRRDHGRARD